MTVPAGHIEAPQDLVEEVKRIAIQMHKIIVEKCANRSNKDLSFDPVLYGVLLFLTTSFLSQMACVSPISPDKFKRDYFTAFEFNYDRLVKDKIEEYEKAMMESKSPLLQ